MAERKPGRRRKAAGKTAGKARPARRGRPPVPIFDALEREALRPPAVLKPSQWAEAYRLLPEGQTDVPGPWRNEMSPYLRAVMDLPVAPGVAEVHIEKASQMGVSEAVRNLIGYLADQEPDPVGLVLPDQSKGRKIVSERIIPLFETTPRLRGLLTGRRQDVQKEVIKLVNAFLLWLAWAGSPSSTKSDPWRFGIVDELDECAVNVQRLGVLPDIVGRVRRRLRSFGDRGRVMSLSTPTDQFSEIHQQVSACRFILFFYVPCPHCGGFQRLEMDQVRYDRPADLVERHGLSGEERTRLAGWVMESDDRVWIECVHCRQRIYESQRPTMVRLGRWCTADGVDEAGSPRETDLDQDQVFDAEAVERWPNGSTIGLRDLWAAYGLIGVSLRNIASEYIRAQGDRAKMYVFVTETQGRPFEEQLEAVEQGLFSAKVARAKGQKLIEGEVPAWTGKLLATVDTQADGFYVVVRAWGPDFQSQRVWHGRLGSFEELEAWLINRPWKSAEPKLGPMLIEAIGIDSGGTSDESADASRTVQVYRWAQKHRSVVRALKGFDSSRTGAPLWRGKGLLPEGPGTSTKARRVREVPLWCHNKHHWQSVLQDLIVAGTKPDSEDAERWLLNDRSDQEYERHMANARQIVERHGTRPVEVWRPLSPGGRWDYRDCEVYQCVLANLCRVDLLPPAEQLMEFRLQQQASTQRQEVAYVQRFRRR